MKYGVALSLALFLIPYVTWAACSANGYTVVYVNGILSTRDSSNEQLTRLTNEYKSLSNRTEVKIIGAHNESHLAGAGDLVQSITQAFNSPVSDYDLKTILMQIEPQVTTRKILLVGHSQGTFYTNELYKYLIANGIPTESIGVYNIATPASYVASGGNYVTSSNDKLINYVRGLQTTGNAALHFQAVSPSLPANITVPPEAGHESTQFAGHKLSVYLDGAAPRIVSDIDAALDRLKASESSAGEGGCFEPPKADMGYYTKAGVYVVADSLTSGAVALTSSVLRGADEFTGYAAQGLKNIGHFANYLFSQPTAVAANTQAGAAALALPKISTAHPEETLQQPKTTVASPVAPEPESPAEPIVPEQLPANIAEPIVEQSAPAVATNAQTSLVPIQPGFGGGGVSTNQSAQETSANPTPLSVSLVVSSPESDSVHATTSISASGTASANALITITIGSASATTSSDGTGNWTIALALAEGTSTLGFVATDASGNQSVAISRTITVDTSAPVAPVLAIAECVYSLAVDSCVIPDASASLSWDAVSDAVSYAVEQDAQIVATTSLRTHAASIALDATSTFAVIAYDAVGNQSRSATVDVATISNAIIVNEVAWAGTEFAADQWIELKNLASRTLDLSHTTISRSGGEPIALSGTIEPNGYVVVENHNINSFDLNEIVTPFDSLATDHAEQLALVWNGITLDATPGISTCPSWCAGGLDVQLGSNRSGVGNLYSSQSMERISETSDGLSASSWRSTDSYSSALGTPGATVWGTAGYPNSEGLPDRGVYCGTSTNFAVADQAFHLTGECTYLSRFITAKMFGVRRYVSLYRGTVGNATNLFNHDSIKEFAAIVSYPVPSDAVAGEQFFFAIFEIRNGSYTDAGAFGSYFIDGTQQTPHDNYLIVPFTYLP